MVDGTEFLHPSSNSLPQFLGPAQLTCHRRHVLVDGGTLHTYPVITTSAQTSENTTYLLGSAEGDLLVEDGLALVQLLAVHGEQYGVLGLEVSVYKRSLNQLTHHLQQLYLNTCRLLYKRKVILCVCIPSLLIRSCCTHQMPDTLSAPASAPCLPSLS